MGLRSRRLIYKALRFDKAGSTISRFAGFVPGKMVEELEETRKIADIDGQALYGHTNQTRETALSHTLCGRIHMYTKNGKYFTRDVGELTDFSIYEKWAAWIMEDSPPDKALYDYDVGAFNRTYRAVSVGRRFIATKKGYIGFAPENCKKGDLAVVLAGGDVPYVLRREATIDPLPNTNGSPQCYTILGDAYIHGIMDGEAFEQLDETKGELEEFVLV